jgi:ATP-dependent DNA helicase RecQ
MKLGRSTRPAATDRGLPPALRKALQEKFGIRQLRDGQRAVIERVLRGEDTLAIMPTGAGKSICYQLPALQFNGATVVVSPLIALMKDQFAKVDEAGLAAEQLHSAQPKREQDASMQRIDRALSDIIFTTPERLSDPAFMQTLQRHPVSLVVVDEAHCLSQWGHDFRPAYLEVGTALRALGDPPVLALTATATADVVDDIRRQLRRPGMAVVNTGVYRPNLRMQVVRCTREEHKFDALRTALRNGRGSGIVYTATVKACTALFDRLRDAGESVAQYHGRLSARERAHNQDRFMSGALRLMVATNAFGMGIDKPDIRFVLHYQMPGSLEAYYQEAGRAGRDGELADCALLFFPGDRQVQQFFMAKRYPSAVDLQQVLQALERAQEPLPVRQLSEWLPDIGANRLAVCLSVLRGAGLAATDRGRMWRAVRGRGEPPLERLADAYARRAEHDRDGLERMVFYAQTAFCRWRVLLEHFDEVPPFEHGRCGRCDNCLHPPAAEPAAADKQLPKTVPAFERGTAVRVPRYGDGIVERATADEVDVVFADGRTRAFVAAFVEAKSDR